MPKIRGSDPYKKNPDKLIETVTRAQEELDAHERAIAAAVGESREAKLELEKRKEYFLSRVKYYASYVRQYERGKHTNAVLASFDKKHKSRSINQKQTSPLANQQRQVKNEPTNVLITINTDEWQKRDQKPKCVIKSEIHLATMFGLHTTNQAERDQLLNEFRVELKRRVDLYRVFNDVTKKCKENGNNNPYNRTQFKSNKKPELIKTVMQRKNIHVRASGNRTAKNYKEHCAKLFNQEVPPLNAKPEVDFYNNKRHFDQNQPVAETVLKMALTTKSNNLLKSLISTRDPQIGSKRASSSSTTAHHLPPPPKKGKF